MIIDYACMAGKTVLKVEGHPDRTDLRGDDAGIILHFTDGSSFRIAAYTDRCDAYLREEFIE